MKSLIVFMGLLTLPLLGSAQSVSLLPNTPSNEFFFSSLTDTQRVVQISKRKRTFHVIASAKPYSVRSIDSGELHLLPWAEPPRNLHLIDMDFHPALEPTK